MAIGRETPRQKMISMMYLVLTAMLALNVSSEILKGFITVDESLEHSNAILTENNSRMEAAFLNYVNQGNVEAKPYYDQSQVTKQRVQALMAYVDSMKFKLISKVEKTQQPDTVQMRYMKSLEDFDTPTYLFLGSDETQPIRTAYSALELKGQLNALSTALKNDLSTMQQTKKTALDNADFKSLNDQLSLIKPSDKGYEQNGIKMNWEQENFYHLPTAAVLTNLEKMQTDLKNLESEFLRVFSAASTKYIPKFNTLQAKVLAPVNYVQAGEWFSADILLSAGSTELTPDRMRVLLGAEYDSTTKQLKTPGEAIPLKDGIGKWQTLTGNSGSQSIKGVIAYKKPNGDELYFPFAHTYTVAQAFSAVGADNMNVFYVGVDNPLSASAAGILPNDLVVNVSGSGASIKPNGIGKYVITATNSGTCLVSVFSKTGGVLKAQGLPKVFRVKNIPQPVAKINGRPVLSTLELNSLELQSINSLGAVCLGFEFPVSVKVTHAVVTAIGRDGTLIDEVLTSSALTPRAMKLLSELKPGRRAFIEAIKVSINGQNFSVPDVIIKRKA